jgi:hypothetical protein
LRRVHNHRIFDDHRIRLLSGIEGERLRPNLPQEVVFAGDDGVVTPVQWHQGLVIMQAPEYVLELDLVVVAPEGELAARNFTGG